MSCVAGNELLDAALSDYSDKLYLLDVTNGETAVTFGQCRVVAEAWIRALHNVGVEGSDRILVALPNGLPFATLYIASLLGGFTIVPIASELPAEDLNFIANTVRARAIICDQSYLVPSKALPDSVTVLSVDSSCCLRNLQLTLNWPMVSAPAPIVGGEIPSCITFTSGTTARPKGVAHTATSLLGNAQSFSRMLALGPRHRFLHTLPMFYMAGFLNSLLVPLMSAASVVLLPQLSAGSALRFWETARPFEPNIGWFTPTLLNLLSRLDRNAQSQAWVAKHFELFFSATAPLTGVTRNQIETKYQRPVLESYGLSELLLISVQLPEGERQHGDVGTLLPEVKVETSLDDTASEPSELHVITPFRMLGYIDPATGQPDPETAPLSFPTGDLVQVSAKRVLKIVGRAKDLIIRGGTNISPRAVEEVVLRHRAIDTIAVVGKPHEFLGEEVVGCVKLRPNADQTVMERELSELCSRYLPVHARPSSWHFVSELPRTINGKIKKDELRAMICGKQTMVNK